MFAVIYLLVGFWIVHDVKEDVRILASSTEKFSPKLSLYGTEDVFKKINVYQRFAQGREYANATTTIVQKPPLLIHGFFVAKVWMRQTFMSSLDFGGNDDLKMTVQLSDWKWKLVDIEVPGP